LLSKNELKAQSSDLGPNFSYILNSQIQIILLYLIFTTIFDRENIPSLIKCRI